MRNSLLVLIVILFVGLLIGAGLTANGSPLPFKEQVENPEGSTLVGTDGQYQTLALIVVGTLVILGGMAIGLAGLFYFLARQMREVEAQEPKPFDFSLQSTEGNSIGAVIQQNAFMIALTIGLVLVGLFIALAVTTGALF